ncbi:uncharacterized protein LOC117181484 [Belonocnema kinseyi]|uniref:uncharacterized protein LOC117181484 n=1 Tax=Belonocnema kinseyi TaxID=2817044 RepID=UPI00143D90FF|nr:uncharacterized protein LOC117181484 [Belonocnema kinseyi]
MGLLVLTAAYVLVISLVVTDAEAERNVKDMIKNNSDGPKEQYFNQDFDTHTYNYGYNVGIHSQFHHQNQGLDGITYGCYGHINSHGNLSAIFYVSDGWGYRVVRPEDEVKIFNYKCHATPRQQCHDQIQHFHQHGVSTAWKDVHFPLSCRKYKAPPIAQQPHPQGAMWGN